MCASIPSSFASLCRGAWEAAIWLIPVTLAMASVVILITLVMTIASVREGRGFSVKVALLTFRFELQVGDGKDDSGKKPNVASPLVKKSDGHQEPALCMPHPERAKRSAAKATKRLKLVQWLRGK